MPNALEIRLRLHEAANLGPLLEGVPAVQTKLIDNGDGTYGLDGIVHVPTAREMGVIDNVTKTRADLKAEIERLRQGLWDCAAAAGTDNDGQPTPAALAHPDIVDYALWAVHELRNDYIEAGGG